MSSAPAGPPARHFEGSGSLAHQPQPVAPKLAEAQYWQFIQYGEAMHGSVHEPKRQSP
jgi:hypothetical protein